MAESDTNENKEKVIIYLDGANFYVGLKKISNHKYSDFNFDFHAFCTLISREYSLVGINYYNVLIDKKENPEVHRQQKRLYNYLRQKQILVHTFPYKNTYCHKCKQPIKKIKGDDIKMAIDMVYDAQLDKYDRAILITGDTDFVPAVELVHQIGKNTTLYYFEGHCGFDLIDLAHNAQIISKTKIRKCGMNKYKNR